MSVNGFALQKKFHSKFKVGDILLDLGYDSKRFVFKSGDVSSAYQISFIHIQF